MPRGIKQACLSSHPLFPSSPPHPVQPPSLLGPVRVQIAPAGTAVLDLQDLFEHKLAPAATLVDIQFEQHQGAAVGHQVAVLSYHVSLAAQGLAQLQAQAATW